MRARTVVSGMSVALGVFVVTVAGARHVATDDTPPIASRVPPVLTEDTLHLMRGDTVTLALATSDTSHLAVLLGDTIHLGVAESSTVGVSATYVTSDSSVVALTSDGGILARNPGDAAVTATSTAMPAVSVAIPIHVEDHRKAVNDMIATVCPNDDDRSFTAAAPISANLPVIHEYHDCQRLIANGSYGPAVGIFADTNVVIAKSWRDYVNGKVAALIVSFADKHAGVYRPLGINTGVSCLVLKADSAGYWKAAIVGPRAAPPKTPFGHAYSTCDDHMTWASVPQAAMNKLDVREEGGVDIRNRPIAPPTARWDWDPEQRLNYIGVKCGDASWCEIGPRGFHSSAPITLKGGTAPLFRGYYDQQYLANPVSKAVSSVFGTILPGRDLDTTRMKHKHQHWYHVAELRFEEKAATESASYASYREQYGAAPTAGLSSTIAVSNYFMTPKLVVWKHSGYFGRLNNHLMKLGAITYRLHARSQPVPTVRWRWDLKDEKTWSYCDPEGCCENVSTFY